jgi:hypothetical protein
MLRFTFIACRQVTFTPMHLASWRAVVGQLDAMCRPRSDTTRHVRFMPDECISELGLLYEAKPCIIHCSVSAGISRKPSRLLSPECLSLEKKP